jgi:pre-mRNA-splicing helicase BRR2
VELNQTHLKTNILLQSHFNREPISIDLRTDQRLILEKTIRLVHAMVDVISTNGFLQATLLAMELSQMVVQAMWPKQSALLQLPGFDRERVDKLKTEGVEEIADFVNMEDDVRAKVLPIPE